ncbi:hypothetical protein BDV18DRAFT_161012 [Aspergillus unguis]
MSTMSTEQDLWESLVHPYPTLMEIQRALDSNPQFDTPQPRKTQITDLYTMLKLVVATAPDLEVFEQYAEVFFAFELDLNVLIYTLKLIVSIEVEIHATKPGGGRQDPTKHQSLKRIADRTVAEIMNWGGKNTNLDKSNTYRDVALCYGLLFASALNEPYPAQRILADLRGAEVDILFFAEPLFAAVEKGSVEVLQLLVDAMYTTDPVAAGRTGSVNFKEIRATAEMLELPEHDRRVQEQVQFLKATVLAEALESARPLEEGLRASIFSVLIGPLSEYLNGIPEIPAPLAVTIEAVVRYQTWDAGSLSRLVLEAGWDAFTPEVREQALQMIREMERMAGLRAEQDDR